MKFEFENKNKQITNSELINDLKVVCENHNLTSLSMSEYDLYGKYNSSTITRRFKTWNNALKIAKIDIRNRQFSEKELMNNLKNVWISKGKQPARRDMDNKKISQISSGAYFRKYGSWSNALKEFQKYIENDKDDILEKNIEYINNHKTSRDINLRLRFKVFQRDNFKCKLCGASPATNPNVILHVDHIIPYSKGGETVIENLQTLCSNCNLGKSNMKN